MRRGHRSLLAGCALAALLVTPACQTSAPPAREQGLPTASPAVPPTAPPARWRLRYRDDFDVLDASVWGVYDGPGNGDTGPRSAKNAFTSRGHLVLRTTQHAGEWHGAGVSSGRGRLAQTYGKFLVRARFERGYGVRAVALLWPTAPWPPEVDFLELPASDSDRTQNMISNHYRGAAGGHEVERAWVAGNFTTWHTVGVEWTPTALTYTLDGRAVAQMTSHVPHQPMWLGLQTAQGLIRRGIVPDAATTPKVDFLVDWVEIYTYEGPAN